MPYQRLEKIKPLFFLFDIILSFISTFTASFLYFYILNPEKKVYIISDSAGLFAPGKWFPEYLGFFVTYSFLSIIYSITQVLCFIFLNLYREEIALQALREFWEITKAVFLNLFIVMSLFFFYRGASYSRAVFLLIPIHSIIFLFLGHRLFWYLTSRYFKQKNKITKALLIGTNSVAEIFFRNYEKNKLWGNSLEGVIGPAPKRNSILKNKYLGNINLLEPYIQKIKPTLIFYTEAVQTKSFTKVQYLCDQEGIPYSILFEPSQIFSRHSRLENFYDLPMLVQKTPLQDGTNLFYKRIFDIFFSLVFLILLLPLFIFISFLIKLEALLLNQAKAPIFFSQERIGLDQKSFHVFKFRTMVPQIQKKSDTVWGKKNDPRVTRLGSFLRKSSIDELPQLWNVFIGNMSIVGPRPERPFFVQKFKTHYKKYMQRHATKSGLTGWAQIQGLRGDTSIEERVRADIYYIENWSFFLDLFIILKTLPAMLRNPGE